jgi:hypothetical protein
MDPFSNFHQKVIFLQFETSLVILSKAFLKNFI